MIWRRFRLDHWALRGAAFIGAALAVEYVTQFGRSLVLSHLLGPTEFGIGSAMVILWVLIDMSTGLGADRYLVQAQDGGSEISLAAAHSVTLVRNGLSACLVLALAGPTASMLGVPQARGSFFCLALVPLIRGFEHLRLSQLQRGNVFLPWAAATASMHVFGLVVVVASALVFRDHRAVLWSLGAQATGLVVSTHVLARVPYRLSLARLPISRALHFGMPLMLNGLAIAAIGQVDRLAVGSFLGVVQLGRYGLATMIFYLPVSLVMRIVTATLAPRLSTAWHVSPRWEFPALYRQIAFAIAVVAVLLASLVALMGNAIVSMVFGQVYRVDDGFFAILALVVLMKFAKITLNFAGLAMGRTVDVMVSNLPNAIGLGLTILGIMLVPSLSFAALGALAGEALGAAAALVLVRRHFRDDAHGAWLPMLTIVPVPCLAAAWSVLAAPPLDERVAVLGFGGVLAVCGAALLYRRRKPHFAVWS